MTGTNTVRIPENAVAAQLAAIFAAWGMAADVIEPTVRVMVEADLRGIDSHGVTMMDVYDTLRRDGRLNLRPDIRVVRETPVTAVVDGGGGLGHAPSVLAMEMAIAKGRSAGLAAVTVRNSNHYGAAGIYASMAAEAGLIGISTSAVHKAAIVPTFGTRAMFGTNPLAFAAPASANRPFVLDMATSTAAIGKLRLAAMAGKPVPEGWALDEAGRPVTDPREALAHRLMTPLGGTREMGGHKGYGLAAMVEILSSVLSGGSIAALRGEAPGAYGVGHFFMTIDPKAFRDEGEFETDLDGLIDALHGCPRADPGQPVLVHGDPEADSRADRRANGIPLHPDQVGLLRRLARDGGAAFLLEAEEEGA
ncbi:Ldh family oxidoreductase (plasmid) [Skermanella mucosa]|uniref:Ldh family oxidoreductase n=1 Tax=Skermanella mucosa TaxID=1789672 RepID=UPI00192BE764|nr:Ldh family oxidoreductase [Skermanella mucosa]UEM25195.1 Ldh family oxidoreductase [Skermanella mucosa]